MDQTTRNHLQRATQDARRVLEAEFAAQLEGTFDILPDGRILPEPGSHLDDRQRLVRREIAQAIEHIRAKESGKTTAQAIDDYRREAAFTFLNRFAALKMLEARGLVQPCVSKGDQSAGFKEYGGLAPGLADLPDKGYRLYLECLFDELGTEVKVLFDRRDPAALLWPRRQALTDLLEVLNRAELAGVWGEDEAIGWVYQYFNSQEERRAMREASQAPRNSRELAVRNQFFTPRYVVEFLTDNTLGRIWYEMRQGLTGLKELCRFLVHCPTEIFLSEGESAPQISESQESLSQEELLKQPVYIPFRRKKDPRDLKVLDPACGSGHFLLYCFDLLLAIYLEAWEDAPGSPDAPVAHAQETPPGPPLSRGGEESARPFPPLVKGGPGAVPGTNLQTGGEALARPFPPLDKGGPGGVAGPALSIGEEASARPFPPLDKGGPGGVAAPATSRVSSERVRGLSEDCSSPKSELTGKSLRDDYPSPDALRLAIPGLILRHNLNGIDIDPRCAQIAALALWMRAQRAFNDLGISRDERPAIRKTNIVVAEPMPGERDMLDGFLRSLREDRLESLMRKALGIPDDQRVQATKAMAESLCQLVETVWEKMRLAGEAGSLLKIEEELASAIGKGRDEWEEKLPLFRVTEYSLGGRGNEKYYRHLPEDGQDFWDKAETLTLRAIEEYAASSQNGDQFRRRMFAEDATRGFAFIDLCRRRFDVALMNPPFGESSKLVRGLLDKHYPRTKNDLYAAFVEMGLRRLLPGGLLGAITSRTGFFLSSFQKWREEILLREAEPTVFADLGYGVLDTAMVETAAYCLRKAIWEKDLGGDHGQDINPTTLAPLNAPQHK